MQIPERGDVLLRGNSEHGYVVVDAVTQEPIGDPVTTVEAAIALAEQCGAETVWQQPIDNRGRVLGDLFPIKLRSRAAATNG